MKKIIGVIILIAALTGCYQDDLSTANPICNTTFTGNTYKAFPTGRAATATTALLESGCQILVNATGGLQMNNEVLTFSDNRWISPYELNWQELEKATQVTAFYPVLPDLDYTETNLYEGNTLKDILYAQESAPANEQITFRFKHLFSLLTFLLNDNLQTDFQSLEVSYPAVVSSIDVSSATFTIDNQKEHTTRFTQPSASGAYSVLVPSGLEMPIHITIRSGEKGYTTTLNPQAYAENKEYQYRIQKKENGIQTAKQWIRFSQLINQRQYSKEEKKELEGFGKTVNGVTTYYLLNDIDFTGVDCSTLEHIGHVLSNRGPYFSDVFDGQGHTISNLTPVTYYGVSGIFGAIDANAVIKNLHIKSCTSEVTDKSYSSSFGLGILIGRNEGLIQNCSVEDCKLTTSRTTSPPEVGALAGYSEGTIANCYVRNCTISCTGKEDAAGAIVGKSSGQVLNCYSANNYVKNEKYRSGGLVGEVLVSRTLDLQNCYVYDLKQPSTKVKGVFIGLATTATINHCFANAENKTSFIGEGSNKEGVNFRYNSNNTCNGTPLWQLLNEWIDNEGATLYPDIRFTKWKASEDLPAVFVY